MPSVGVRTGEEGASPHELEAPRPIDMVLFCPNCGMKHIDRAEADLSHEDAMRLGAQAVGPGEVVGWTNPPHKSHLCRREDGGCGCIWRPANVPTNGVAKLEAIGRADTFDLGAVMSITPPRPDGRMF